MRWEWLKRGKYASIVANRDLNLLPNVCRTTIQVSEKHVARIHFRIYINLYIILITRILKRKVNTYVFWKDPPPVDFDFENCRSKYVERVTLEHKWPTKSVLLKPAMVRRLPSVDLSRPHVCRWRDDRDPLHKTYRKTKKYPLSQFLCSWWYSFEQICDYNFTRGGRIRLQGVTLNSQRLRKSLLKNKPIRQYRCISKLKSISTHLHSMSHLWGL